MAETSKQSIDDIISRFNPTECRGGRDDKTTLTTWVPTRYKEEFNRLQDETNKEFGRVLRKVILAVIDRFSEKNVG